MQKEVNRRIVEKKKAEDEKSQNVPAFVTFGSSYNKEFVERTNDRKSVLFKWMRCFGDTRKYFSFTDRKGNKTLAKIMPAPEP